MSTTDKPADKVTLLQFYERVYLPDHLKDKKPSYRQVFCRSVDRFVAFFRGDIVIAKITAATFKQYLDWYRECNRGAPATAYGDVVRIREMLVVAGRTDLRRAKMRNKKPERVGTLPDSVGKFYQEVYRKQRTLSPRTDQQMQIAVNFLIRYFYKKPGEHDVPFDRLPGKINDWIQDLELTLSPITVKQKRAAIISIWILAAENGVCEPPNTRIIRRPKTTRPAPDAWTVDEMRALLQACQLFRGQFYSNGIDRGRFWEAFIRICYETGLRRGDMLAMKRSQLEKVRHGGHVLRSVQHKTGDGIIHRLSDKAMAAVKAIMSPDRELIFDYPHALDTFHDHWKDILDHAGIDPLNRRNGVQKLRRTSASHLERVSPGAATAHLGHRSGDMAQKHYLDPKISRGDLPQPPAIDQPHRRAGGAASFRERKKMPRRDGAARQMTNQLAYTIGH